MMRVILLASVSRGPFVQCTARGGQWAALDIAVDVVIKHNTTNINRKVRNPHPEWAVKVMCDTI